MDDSNFSFLKDNWPVLTELGKAAERNLYIDPNASLFKLRRFGEEAARWIFYYEDLEMPEENTQFNRLKAIEEYSLTTDKILEIMHELRKVGNEAVHDGYDLFDDAAELLSSAYKLGIWFMQTYGNGDFTPEEFGLPTKDKEDQQAAVEVSKGYEEELTALQQDLQKLRRKKVAAEEINRRLDEGRRSLSRLESAGDLDLETNRRKFITTEPLEDESEAKVKVWESIRRSFRSRECLGYWRYPIFSKVGEEYREPYILVIDRELGLIVLDIKELTIDQIASINGRYWQYNNFTQDNGMPHKEAEHQLMTLLGYCDVEPELKHSIAGKAVLVLPEITEREWQERDFIDRKNLPPVILGDELGAKTLLTEIKEAEAAVVGDDIKSKEWKLLLAVLSGTTIYREESRESDKNQKTRAGVKSIIKDYLHEMDLQQEEIGKSIPPGPQRIRGIAGSGKTVLLCQKAAHMYVKNPDWKIALVFFTRSLYQSTIDLLDKWISHFTNGREGYNPEKNDRIQVLHAWGGRNKAGFYSTICSEHGVRPLTVKDLSRNRTPGENLIQACKLLLEEQEINPLFNAVLIDEAQDLVVDDDKLLYEDKQPFFWLAYQALKAIPKNDKRRLIWAYDEAQSLNSLKIPTAPQLFGDDPEFKRMVSGIHKGGIRKSEIMSKCYRTPGPILTAAHAIGMGLLRPEGMLTGFTTQKDWERIGYEVQEGSFNPPGQKIVLHRPDETMPNRVPELWNGPVIEFENYDSRGAEFAALTRSIKQNLNQDKLNPSRDILIILLGSGREVSRLRKRVASYLQSSGINIYIPTAVKKNIISPEYPNTDSNKFWEDGAVTISNIYRAKGNEAYMVYVLGLDRVAENEADVGLRNQLFVALTRTKGWVNISGIGDYPFYQELRSVIDSGSTFEFTFQRPQVERK